MKLIFNSSMPRSGSTLLQNILGQNESIYPSATSGVLELIYAARANFSECNEFKAQDSELMKKGFIAFCKGGLEGWYSAVTDKSICVDKSRGWFHYYNLLSKIVDKPKVIVCVRDLRSVLASMEQLYQKNQEKADKAENPAQMQFITVHQRIANWMSGQPVGLSMLRLYEAVRNGNIDKFCVVRYEDLVSDPEKVMKNLYNYIEEPYFAHNFSEIPQITNEDDSFYDIYGDHKIRPQLVKAETDPLALLGKQACDNILNENAWFFDYFYSAKSKFY